MMLMPHEEKTRVVGATGEWDPAMFEAYRAATGERKRMIANRIILDNTPLLKLLTEQLCGRAKYKKGQKIPKAAKMGGRGGFDEIPWDDAMQAARIGLMKALDQFDPVKAKGRIALYLAFKVRYELQCLVRNLHTISARRGQHLERPDVVLMDDDAEIDRLAGGTGDILTLPEGMTVDDLTGWQESGQWPEEMLTVEPESIAGEEAHPQAAFVLPARVLPPPPPGPGWARFIGRCRFVEVGRVPLYDSYNQYRLDCRQAGDGELKQGFFVGELRERYEVREIRVWDGCSRRGLGGLRVDMS
jgi:hypothetical protein